MKKILFLTAVALFVCMPLAAQEKGKGTASKVTPAEKPAPQKKWFAIHEDVVIPSQDARYAEAMKKLKDACTQHNVPISWVTVRYDDNSYVHLMPITKFGDLDKNAFEDLSKKIGKEAFGKLMSGFDGCYTMHHDFIVEEMTSHCYLAPTQEENFRDIVFWRVNHGKEGEAENIIMEWKKLYEAKKATNGFLAFKIVFGEQPGFAIVHWGKDEVDSATKAKKTRELLQADMGDLMQRTMAITSQIQSKRGWVLSEYSLMLAGSN